MAYDDWRARGCIWDGMVIDWILMGLGAVEEFSLHQTLLGSSRKVYENLLRYIHGKTGDFRDGFRCFIQGFGSGWRLWNAPLYQLS